METVELLVIIWPEMVLNGPDGGPEPPSGPLFKLPQEAPTKIRRRRANTVTTGFVIVESLPSY